MTEADWLVCEDPTLMLYYLQASKKISARKVRLFACACHRLLGWPSQAVILAEKFADGLIDEGKLEQVHKAARQGWDRTWPPEFGNPDQGYFAAQAGSEACRNKVILIDFESIMRGIEQFYDLRDVALLFRDIAGNPFRPVTIQESWLASEDSAVLRLAQDIYDNQAFGARATLERLPILADALLKAGCTNEDILNHCRSLEHVRGCWVVDLLLGKS